jgi:hypothetical protein
MSDEPENYQQNVVNDRRGKTPGARQAQFKPGFDKRRWLGGRGKKSPEQREGDEILRAVIWEELSREFDTNGMKPLETPETIDALRLMVRTWIKKKPELIAERIAGKVTEKHEFGGMDGKELTINIRKASDGS